MKINWLDESPITYDEAMELLSHSHDKRLEMEEKNKWDAYVNDSPFRIFLHDTYCYMLDEVRKEVDIDLYYFYPKIKELFDWEVFLGNSDNTLATDVLKEEEKEDIWEIVEAWWKATFRILYFY